MEWTQINVRSVPCRGGSRRRSRPSARGRGTTRRPRWRRRRRRWPRCRRRAASRSRSPAPPWTPSPPRPATPLRGKKNHSAGQASSDTSRWKVSTVPASGSRGAGFYSPAYAPAAKTQVATAQSTLQARPHAAEPSPAPDHSHGTGGADGADELGDRSIGGRGIGGTQL
uniref:Uncharacterized protein n=1 Tax=Zea mays TaxID=4577 RepID=C0PK12_MAIZE|nr:unknown [Zea mays]